MSRPSRNIDKRLIDAGIRLLPKYGLSGISVREVARRADVNLGMFHYHFRSKSDFSRRVLSKIYSDFFERFRAESFGEGAPAARLTRALTMLARFARDNRPLLMALIRDLVSGNPDVIRGAKSSMPRHVGVLLDLIRACQADGTFRAMPPAFAMSIVGGMIGFPNLLLGIFGRAGAKRPMGVPIDQLESMLISDAAIEQRIEMIFRVLAPVKGGSK